MKRLPVLNKKIQISIFIFSILIYLFFYISAYFTHTFSSFFAPATIGQDFFSIPNGAYAFLHGGNLTGQLPYGVAPYINCCRINVNVYHPLLTLLVGIPLQFFSPWIAMTLWALLHILVMAGLLYFLWRKFRQHPYIYLALSLLLINSYNYYEIWLTQYQFLVNFFSILFLYESVKHGDTKKAGMWLLFSLLVKPIGLLWILPLLLYKRKQTVAIGFGLYALITAVFSLFPFGQYYLHNFLSVSMAIIPAHNLYAIYYIFPSFPLITIKLLSILTAIALILLQIIKKPNLFSIITLWVGYQLLFYPLVYHYQYTMLAGIFCLGILLNIFSLKKLIIIPIIFLTIPTPVIFFHLFGEMILSRQHLSLIWLYSAFWLCCFLLCVVVAIIRKEKQSSLR